MKSGDGGASAKLTESQKAGPGGPSSRFPREARNLDFFRQTFLMLKCCQLIQIWLNPLWRESGGGGVAGETLQRPNKLDFLKTPNEFSNI